ncbi:Two component system, signal transduction histidine kinase [Acididesulfobacillus acetoxydans]|uniref:histidine kinase n=1 Tax=Acididesulfobacillus acetoxydans TaxID=1561005 RepID=A0A8S0Y2N0_9FIRM|nr:ATP-binding protein [Acididesulfobacillus acetoxydans]CAA7600995.1 Two component system, signal transduction histidine kinase [Acididesulfobacillus acetoxydans]CEJ07718.1 Signal transduction histidine kinase [Acididesulfobacillus acetoxydans]
MAGEEESRVPAKPVSNQTKPSPGKSRFAEWRNSLSAQLLTRFWLSLIVFFIIVALVQYKGLQSFLMQQEQINIKTEINIFAERTLDNWITQATHPASLSDLRPGNILVLFSPDGQVRGVITQRAWQKAPELQKLLTSRLFPRGSKSHAPFVWTVGRGKRFLVLFRPLRAVAAKDSTFSARPLTGYAAVLAPLTQMDILLQHELRLYGITALIIMILGGVAAFYVVRKPLKPLRGISDVSAKIAAGEYSLRLPFSGGSSEIEHLRLALNHMLGILADTLHTEQSAREEMARFIADASHELRTPLTSIRGFLEILLRNRETNPESLRSAHRSMLTETERLIRLTEDLLTLDHLALMSASQQKDIVSTAVAEVLYDLSPLLESLVLPRLLTVRAEPLTLPLTANELKQVLFNLVQNATQHTPPNGRIEVTLTRSAGDIVLSVSDNGEGIAPDDLPHVFERFYRGSRSRQRNKGQGAGLGLAIVREIARVRGGRVGVSSERGEGSIFSLYFPGAHCGDRAAV